MIKPIKFDLKLSNGTKLATLDDLEENLSPALFEHFHSGKLAKWLRVRKLEELADKMETLQTEYLEYKNELDVQLFKKLCEVFVSEVDLEDAREAIAEFHALPVVQIENTEEIEESKDLMVIEQPKTKEFRVNERLLYKTFIELGGAEHNDISHINYAKGEYRSEKLLELLGSFSISIDDVLICFREFYSGQINRSFILTNNYLMLGSGGGRDEKSVEKISLTDISYLNCIRDFEYRNSNVILLVNHHNYVCDARFYPLYLFLKDYLALEEIEDKFEQVEEIEKLKNPYSFGTSGGFVGRGSSSFIVDSK